MIATVRKEDMAVATGRELLLLICAVR
jgi:hypothetical protein